MLVLRFRMIGGILAEFGKTMTRRALLLCHGSGSIHIRGLATGLASDASHPQNKVHQSLLTVLRNISTLFTRRVARDGAVSNNLLEYETQLLGELRTIREELSRMRFSARIRNVLLITEFGTKEPAMSLKDELGIELEEIKLITTKFKYLSGMEGKLLRMLQLEKVSLDRRLKEWSTQHDFDLKSQVARVSHERVIACFQTMREATQYYELLDHLNQSCEFIMHESCSEEILRTLGRDLKEKFPFLSEHLLKHGIDAQICKLQDFEEAKLNYEFSLDTKHCEDADRQASTYEDDLKERFDSKKNEYLQASNPFMDPIYEMVLRTREGGYQMIMEGDPETEIRQMVKRYKEVEIAKFKNEEYLHMFGDIYYQHWSSFDTLFVPFLSEPTED